MRLPRPPLQLPTNALHSVITTFTTTVNDIMAEVSQAEIDRLSRSVEAFGGFKSLFQRPDAFTEDVSMAMRSIRAKFLGSGDRLTALLADLLGQKRPTNLSETASMHDRLVRFGFGTARSMVSLTGVRASTPVNDSGAGTGKAAAKESAKKSPALFKPLRVPRERGAKSTSTGSRPSSVENLRFDYEGQFEDTDVTEHLDDSIPAVGEFTYADLTAFEVILDRLLVDKYLAQLSQTDKGQLLADEVYRNGGDQSFLQAVFLCHHSLNPNLDGGRTAAMTSFLDAVKAAEEGGSPRKSILALRDALALATDSGLTLSGIMSRTVRGLLSSSTDLTSLINTHISDAAGEETLATFDTMVQAVFDKAGAIGFNLQHDQSGIVPVKGANQTPSTGNATDPARIKCPRCGTMQRYGHGSKGGKPGDRCGTKQMRNEDGTVIYPEKPLPKSTLGKMIDMNEAPFKFKQGDPYYSECKGYVPRAARPTKSASAQSDHNDTDEIAAAAMQRHLSEYGLDKTSVFSAKAFTCKALCAKAQVCDHEGVYSSECPVCTMSVEQHAANLAVRMQEEEAAARASAEKDADFNFRAEVDAMCRALPARQRPTPQSVEDRKQLRDDAMKSYGVAPHTIRDVLKARSDGVKLSADDKAVIGNFNAAMGAMDKVAACIPCPYTVWRKQAVQKQASTCSVKAAGASPTQSLCLDTGASNTIVVPGTISNIDTGDKLMFGGFNGAGQRSKGAGAVKFVLTDTNDLPATINVKRSHEVEGADTILMCLRDIFAERIQLFAISENEIHLKFPSGQKVNGRLSDEGILLFDYTK